jgi:hypothetical protein
MKVSDIQRAIQAKYNTHLYELYNSYVFEWECDFFSITKSGYCYEVEIKLSRADYFADFKKEKHSLFKRLIAGDGYYFRNYGPTNGEYLCTYEVAELKNKRYWDVVERPVGVNRYETPDRQEHSERHSDKLNHWKNWTLEKRTKRAYAPATSIMYTDLNKVFAPNRFYYACPEGLLKPEDIPPYAGLLYVKSIYDVEVVKEAPFIHKRKMDLSSVLLQKFYWECKSLRILKLKSA